jgi:hypothetical protein
MAAARNARGVMMMAGRVVSVRNSAPMTVPARTGPAAMNAHAVRGMTGRGAMMTVRAVTATNSARMIAHAAKTAPAGMTAPAMTVATARRPAWPWRRCARG